MGLCDGRDSVFFDSNLDVFRSGCSGMGHRRALPPAVEGAIVIVPEPQGRSRDPEWKGYGL